MILSVYKTESASLRFKMLISRSIASKTRELVVWITRNFPRLQWLLVFCACFHLPAIGELQIFPRFLRGYYHFISFKLWHSFSFLFWYK